MKNTNQNILSIAREELTLALAATTGENHERLLRARFQISNRMTSSGGTATVGGPNTGLVKLSGPIFRDEANSEDDLRNTIRHELAHIAVGRGHGHGPVWKRMAKHLGCTGDRCHTMVTAQAKARPRFDWLLSCSSCGAKVGTARNRTTVAAWTSGKKVTRCCRAKLAAKKV
tara:strand:+ start:5550 stop:6065 length:516 start_codon:yes stop_codon:yes gene_type:complete